MRHIILLLFAMTGAFAAQAADVLPVPERWAADPTQVFEASEVDLRELQWLARPVIVFANSPRDPSFVEQMEKLLSEVDRLVERDVILIADTDPDARTEVRQRLRPRGFMLALIGKDGEINLRKPLPWTVRELSRTIDKMPVRQREMQERR
ncbi:DUF4174 domain-containing protein [Jannaschia rubra]|uniref:DUF4174 domain-containing protein n=1 Tax=Jannaschia rubra TaxID=282197 RepID=A0A0M6XQ49_9RHOB|nr:DUF4174 domain-containing protein [Jannaschia rubra]CTQ33018.1 hypothetical protein JAN5088_01793 [Jannaschia rubra]SFG58591.1 protein of unknown function [Jannaschia rubra]